MSDPRVNGAIATPRTWSCPGAWHAAFVRSPARRTPTYAGSTAPRCRPDASRSCPRTSRASAATAASSRTRPCWLPPRASRATSSPRWPLPRRRSPARAAAQRSRSTTRSSRPCSTRSPRWRRGRRCSIPTPALRRRRGLHRRAAAAGHQRLPPLPARAGRGGRGSFLLSVPWSTRPSASPAPSTPRWSRTPARRCWLPDGRLELHTGTQTPFNLRADLAGVFAMDEERIRVVAPPWAARSGPRPSPGSRRSWPAWRARRGARSRPCSTARRSGSRSTGTPRSCGCAWELVWTARSWPSSSTAGWTPAPTPTAGRVWPPSWATRASAPTASRTYAWTRSPSTPTCRPTGPSAATARPSRSGPPSGRWTCWRSAWASARWSCAAATCCATATASPPAS